MKISHRHVSIILSFIGFLFLSSCTGAYLKNWTSITYSDEVQKKFESFQVNPNYNYFYSGADSYPRSILGIDKAYKLDSDIWVKIEFTAEIFKEMVSNMQARALWRRLGLYGYAIRNSEGKQIGVWYSIMVSGMAVKIEDGQLTAYPPRDDEYQGYDDRFNK
jgi:hypothetical protein